MHDNENSQENIERGGRKIMIKGYNKLIKDIYTVHKHGNNLIQKKEFPNIIKLECLLYYNYLYQFTADVKELRSLLQNLHKIGKSELSSTHYELDILNRNLKSISSTQQMGKVLQLYNQLEDNLKLFDINDILCVNENVDFKNDRIAVYENIFQDVLKDTKVNMPQIKNNISHINIDDKKIDISAYKLPLYELESPTPKKGGEIKIFIDDLKTAAEEMDVIIANNTSLEPQNYKGRLEKFGISLNDQYGIRNVDFITVKEICHIIGMVGTGKSTLIQVLLFYLSKNGYRSMVLFETVKEVIDNTFLFEQLGVESVAVNGEREQQKRVQKVIEYDEMFINENYAKYLTGNCYISNLTEGTYDDLANYGEEPCYKMKSDNKPTLCPFFSVCPRKQNTRKLNSASIVFANVNSLLSTRTGLIKERGRILLLEYALDFIDVVIFDEADAVQIKLDKTLNESEYAEDLLKSNFSEIKSYIEKVIYDIEFEPYRDLYVDFTMVMGALSEVKFLINNNTILKNFQIIKNGQWFSAFVLINSAQFLPEKFREDYLNFVQNNKSEFSGLEDAYILKANKLNAKYEELYERYSIESKHREIVKFLMALVFTEKYIFSLQSELEQVQKLNNNAEKAMLPNIFRKINQDLGELLPNAPTNNRFGFLYDRVKNTLQIFRQQAIGRSAMIDLPYLKIDKNGNPLGPHTILLSGSSFAPGSQAGHIYRPVNYILEPPNEMQEFIKKINIKHMKTDISVSGIEDKKTALIEMCCEYKDIFIDASNDEGRSLIIVNSYQQADWVQTVLNQILPSKVYRLVPDSEKAESYCIQRNKVNQSESIDYKFLVAPASAISRGFNIVDSNGHSLFKKLFLLIRPMSKPKQVEDAVAIVNGKVTELLSKSIIQVHSSEQLKQIQNARSHAQKVWNVVLRDFYSINYADEIVKKNIIVSRLVLLMQLIGRLLRITDYEAAVPEIILLDHAFVGKRANTFNLLEEIENYLELECKNPKHGVLMEKLYMPFLEGLRRGKSIV